MPLQVFSLLNRFFALTVILLTTIHFSSAQSASKTHPWSNSSLSADERAAMVVKAMTIEPAGTQRWLALSWRTERNGFMALLLCGRIWPDSLIGRGYQLVTPEYRHRSVRMLRRGVGESQYGLAG